MSNWIRRGLFALALCGSANMAHAQMGNAEYRDAQRAFQTVAESAAQFELCGVNTSDLPQLLHDHSRRCGASSEQLNELAVLFIRTKARQRAGLQSQGLTCTWTPGQANGAYNDIVDQVRIMMRRGC